MATQTFSYRLDTRHAPENTGMNRNSQIRLHDHNRSGLTMVEILVVVGILSIIAVILVPQLRVVNRDRSMRESARVVAATFVAASQRAVNEGTAGVQIIRNDNLIDPGPDNNFNTPDDIAYAGTTLFVMRRVPPYTGDEPGSTIRKMSDYVVTFTPSPFEQPGVDGIFDGTVESDDLIKPGDSISFNSSSASYRIESVTGGTGMTQLVLDDSFLPPVPGSVGTMPMLPFVIRRQPRRLESSRIDLPPGYIIDFRASGELNFGAATRDLPMAGDNPNKPPSGPRPFFYENGVPEPATFFFNARGGIDRYVYSVLDESVMPPVARFVSSRPRVGTQFFLIRELSTEEGGESESQVLQDPASLWVTVDTDTGTANVINTRQQFPTTPRIATTLGREISDARSTASTNGTANQ